MREIVAEEITASVAEMVVAANRYLPPDVLAALEGGLALEKSAAGREVLAQLRENARVAAETGLPLCQDTGVAVFFVSVGQECHITGGSLTQALNAGVAQGYARGFLRNSMCHPFTRGNTGDNTPAVVHTELVPGDGLHIAFMAKGGGSENMSCCTMLTPADGWEGIKSFVLDRVAAAGPNPCPPIILGVGIGGSFDRAPVLAKKALLRPLDQPNPDSELAALEEELLEEVNALGIGPMGLGGSVTALWGPDGYAAVSYCESAAGSQYPMPFGATRGGGLAMSTVQLRAPLQREQVRTLRAGDMVLLSGTIYTARDAAHKRVCEALAAGEEAPFPLQGSVLYYVGPTPAPPGSAIGAAGPTTSYRMDTYTPELLRRGVAATIGKGRRSSGVRQALQDYGGVYFGATGGAGALLAQRILSARVIAYPDLGPEAIRELEVADFPVVVANDCHGGELYARAQRSGRS